MNRTKHRWVGALILSAAVAVGCGELGDGESPDDEALRRGLYGFVGSPNTYWNGVGPDGVGAPAIGIVDVCWGLNATQDKFGDGRRVVDMDPTTTYPGFATVSKWWREAVEDTWGRYAWIQFRGWGTCAARSPHISDDDDMALNRGKMMLYFGPNTPGAAGSACGIGKSPTSATGCYVSPLGGGNFRQVWQNYAIHEVGHGLGFAHEQVRPDNWSGGTTQTCINTADGETGPFGGGMYWNVNGTTTWVDKQSVMCYDQMGKGGFRLSAGDIMGAQRVYGRKPPGAVIGYGGRSAAINGAIQASGASLISWPTSNQWHLLWKAAARSGASTLDLMASFDGSSNWYWRVKNGVVSNNTPTPLLTTSSSSSASRFPRSNMRWKAIGDMCVVVSSATSGAGLSIQKCGTAGFSERWDFFMPTSRQIRLTGTNLCVKAPTSSPALGDLPKLAACASSGSSTQNFTFTTPNTIRFGNLCMAVFGGFPNPASTVGLWDGCDFTPQAQHFQFNMTGRLKTLNQCAAWNGNVSDNSRTLEVRNCQSAPAVINQIPGYDPWSPQDPQDWDMYW